MGCRARMRAWCCAASEQAVLFPTGITRSRLEGVCLRLVLEEPLRSAERSPQIQPKSIAAMPACFLLATADARLATEWERQAPAGRQIVRYPASFFERGTPAGVSAVLILDANLESRLQGLVARHPGVFVGEPGSVPFEQARLGGRYRACFSYEESARKLREWLPLLEELADARAVNELLQQRAQRPENVLRQVPPRPAPDAVGSPLAWWDFMEGAVEGLESRERLLGECRRAARRLMRASHAVFFLRGESCFVADRGGWILEPEDPLVLHLEGHPQVLDGNGLPGAADPLAELAMRNHLAAWSARLLVPVHDNGRLLGFVALGVRDDGRDYDGDDAERAVGFARLFRQFLVRHERVLQLEELSRTVSLAAKYLPSSLLLGPGEKIPGHVPVVVKDLIGQVRQYRESRRLDPAGLQTWRAAAGPVAETGGVWAWWEEAGGEIERGHASAMRERSALLREMALTLCHEMGNPLVSLSTFRQTKDIRQIPDSLLVMIREDIARMEFLEKHFSMLQSLGEPTREEVDVAVLVRRHAGLRGIPVEAPEQPVLLQASTEMLDFCVRSLIGAMAENHEHRSAATWSISLRSSGVGPEQSVLLAFRGEHVELEGIYPEPGPQSTPREGRMAVFLAKEIIRIHRGEIHVGPGMAGREIMLTLRSL